MVKQEVPCASGKYCHKCWHNDTCRLYQYRKKQQMEDASLLPETDGKAKEAHGGRNQQQS